MAKTGNWLACNLKNFERHGMAWPYGKELGLGRQAAWVSVDGDRRLVDLIRQTDLLPPLSSLSPLCLSYLLSSPLSQAVVRPSSFLLRLLGDQ